MIRTSRIWLAFGFGFAILLAALAWVSWTAVRLNRAEAEARNRATLEEAVRLALWRMDSAAGPILAKESTRPYFSYSSFYPAERAYNNMFAQFRPDEIIVPSRLLTERSPYIRLHFQVDPSGAITSPQVPTGNMRDVAERGYLTRDQIQSAAALLEELSAVLRASDLGKLAPKSPAEPQPAKVQPGSWYAQSEEAQSATQQRRNVLEYGARGRAATNVQSVSLPQGPGNVREGILKPVWLGDRLLLTRRVVVKGEDYVQGCWLDAAAIEKWLLAEAADLLPNATLKPIVGGVTDDDVRVLASLPLRLLPGAIAEAAVAPSTLNLSLGLSVGFVVLGALAVAFLLRTAMTLSERRAAFVSAVTHELRTPLTTFRLYAEMLAGGMVTEESKRQEYLETLRDESDRLGHLVENVLAYAQLERGADDLAGATLEPHDFLEHVVPRLQEHARRSGKELVVELPDEELPQSVHADPGAIERVLFNLVDNACKYAAGATDTRIHIAPRTTGGRLQIRVRDHGPGVPPKDARRIFKPFRKSARDAAHSAPGVGLGLALSRSLLRRMGGDLHLEPSETGACFVLELAAA